MATAAAEAVTSVPCHLSGITRLCFAPDGATIFTGGSDCLVRIHKADDPESEPGFHDDHTDAVTSLTCSATDLITASLDNIARHFSYPANQFEGFITRSSGVPIRWVSVDKAGERVAVCSDDLLVKIVHVRDTSRVSLLTDNTKSVRSAAWDPSGKYLTTACCDGKLRIYDMSGSEPVLLKIMEGVIGSSEPDSDISCYVAWHPSGAYFAVPTRTYDVGIISRDGWTKQSTFTHDGHKSVVGEIAWSPNGRYLASAAGNEILVWANESKKVVARYINNEGAISGLAFSPKSNLIAFTSLGGSFHRWTNPVPADLPSPIATEAQQAKKIERLLDDEFGDDVDLEDQGEELADDLADDWIVDDEGIYGADDDEKKWGTGRQEVVNVTKAQDPFVPGSTIMRSKKRYLAFNMIGVVDVTDQESHHVVNVEFHDKSTRRGYHFQDHTKYTMASLGEQGIVYAAPAEGDSLSTVYYRPYDSWASQSDWSVSLLPGEDAVLVAAGGAAGNDSMGSVVVATSRGFVRFLSSSGIQRYLWRLADDVVSMAASRDAVIVVHREGGTSLDGCQNLRYTLIDLDTFELIQEGRIPLPKRVTLTWIGFTSDGTPAIFDSTGLLSVLDRYRRLGQARWVPLLDSSLLPRREGKQENYWPVGVTSSHFSCVILKGNEKEPWFPRPLIQELEMRMPLLNMDNQQGKLEESMVRGEVALSILRDHAVDASDDELEYRIKEREVALDKELLQLVQGACKADNLQRALDVARLMHQPGTIEAAAKVAGFYHFPGLQERISQVKLEKERARRRGEKSKRARLSMAYDPPATNGHALPPPTARPALDFAPRGGPRRSFGGVQRDSTPAASGRSESYIPETPNGVDEPPSFAEPEEREGSPVDKRKREEEVEEFVPAPKKRPEEFPMTNGSSLGAKNPFAKKIQGSNPFAKAAVAKPLDAIKSTSFFERVDDIELSGVPKSAKPRITKKTAVEKPGQGKQTTLLGMKKMAAPPRAESGTEASDMEETQRDDDVPSGVLEESQVQETIVEESMDDD
ncbi:hypothetical protein BCR39DRAFT_529347 [Naematelia encephala]|uniref:Uncharacterized protein n=1 Tax=Naematelia encephala TaxID=71784 RepID=A0A1Y2B8C6_9TREE|nr:hypothetical protein BCR39DRAFT_529347 [Naematelia encephala]